MCSSVLRCVAVGCSVVLQCVAVCRRVLPRGIEAVCSSLLQSVTVRSVELQCVAVCVCVLIKSR